MNAPYYDDGDVTLHHGDALTVARTMPAGSVQTIVTSPPYFGLRDYGHESQLGAESTVGEYVGNLVTLFRELRRTLADDGTLWLNLGDSYSAVNRTATKRDKDASGVARVNVEKTCERCGELFTGGMGRRFCSSACGGSDNSRYATRGVPHPKQLLGVPWRVAFALQDDGWILRSDIIWAKPNPMPESVTDRPTKAHEYLFLLAKSPRYYYDADAIREPARMTPQRRLSPTRQDGNSGQAHQPVRRTSNVPTNEGDRNKRSVWEVVTQPFDGAHFAVYPPELIRPCILAGSRPGDTVLDPFSGSGTTGKVANYEGRKYVGIDLNRDYLDLSLRTRFAAPALNFDFEEDAS